MKHAQRLAKAATAFADLDEGWPQLAPETLVDKAAEAVIAQAARGVILPGDRIVESDLARKLGVSRVPVREALRMLESRGIVVNEPYKGIRLREVTNRRVKDLIEARAALETTAAHRAVDVGHHRAPWTRAIEAATAEMEEMAARDDAYGLAAADTAFHRALCALADNGVIVDLWQTLAQQLTIIFGLATTNKTMPSVVEEHHELLAVLRTGDKQRIAKVLHTHITVMNLTVDYEAIVEARRAQRAQLRLATP